MLNSKKCQQIYSVHKGRKESSQNPTNIRTHTRTHYHPQQLEGNAGAMATPGTSLQDDFRGEASVGGNTGRKKKKKQKSGEETSGNSVKPDLMEEDELVDAAIPMLAENQGRLTFLLLCLRVSL